MEPPESLSLKSAFSNYIEEKNEKNYTIISMYCFGVIHMLRIMQKILGKTGS